METFMNLCSTDLLNSLLNVMYMIWYILIFTTPLLSQNYIYSFKDQIYRVVSHLEGIFLRLLIIIKKTLPA